MGWGGGHRDSTLKGVHRLHTRHPRPRLSLRLSQGPFGFHFCPELGVPLEEGGDEGFVKGPPPPERS